MVDAIYFVVIVLNATGIFRFAALPLHVSIGEISAVLFALNLFYLAIKARRTAPLLLRGDFGAWLFVLLAWPLLTLLYSPTINAREIGLLAYNATLFFGVAVYALSNGLPSLRRAFSASLLITIAGMALSLIAPGHFTAVADLANARTDYMGRPFGFFLQPNSLAVSIGFLFIAWYALRQRKGVLFDVAAIGGFLLLELVTGSRSGILVAGVTGALILGHSWRSRLFSGRLLVTIGVLAICVGGAAAALNLYLSRVGSTTVRREVDLIDRMQAMLSLKLNPQGGVEDDISVQKRMETQAVYWDLVMQKPLLGHGFGADSHYQETGVIRLSAHSDALTRAMEQGLLCPIVFVWMLLRLYWRRGRRDLEDFFETNATAQFVFITIPLFAGSSIFDERTFFVVLGVFVVVAICPAYLFQRDDAAGRITGHWDRRCDRKAVRQPEEADSVSV